MTYSWKDITASYTTKKRKFSTFWARIFSRPISLFLTYFIINAGISANTISVISVFEVLIACLLIACPKNELRILGVCLFVFWHILDCIDGNIARIKKESSFMGEYVDAVSGYCACSFVNLAIGIAAYNTTIFTKPEYFIIAGAVAATCEIFYRLLLNRYTVAVYRTENQKGNDLPDVKQDDPDGNKGIMYIASRISRNFGFSGLYMPFLILSLIFKKFDWLVVFYMFYNVIWMIVTLLFCLSKACKYNKN